jgi:hypothetical protein
MLVFSSLVFALGSEAKIVQLLLYYHRECVRFLLWQTDNGQDSASAPDLLVSLGVVDGNDVPEEFNIIKRKVIEYLSELHNDNTVNHDVSRTRIFCLLSDIVLVV